MMIKNIHNSLPQQRMEHSNSLPYSSFPQKTTFRDASFFAYPRPDHHQTDDSEISIFDAQKYFNESSSNVDTKVSKRLSPVNMINLERIFEQRSSTDLSVSIIPRFSSASSVDGYARNYQACSFNATPTASSEASWNSQTGLLSNPPGAIPVSMRNPDQEKKKGSSSSSKWLFGRKCPCSGKKSVQVEGKLSVSEPKTPARLYHHQRQIQKSQEISMEKNSDASNSDWSKTTEPIIPNTRRISAENHFPSLNQRVIVSGRPYSHGTGFCFPILNQSASMKLVLNSLPFNTNSTPQEDPPRESLEIYQPLSEEPVFRKSTDIQNRMLVSRQSFTFPESPSRTRMTSITDDDVASDASSDLFEIESFSTQTPSYPMYHRRDSLDEASSFNARRLASATNASLIYRLSRSLDEPVIPSIAATEYHEPSEASIDWSVTTAEGFDRVSVTNFPVSASEFDEITMMRHTKGTNVVGGRRVGGGGEGGVSKKKGHCSLLLSCRCEEAVSVGPNPVKCLAGSSTRHVSSATSTVNHTKPPLAGSPSDGLSQPLAT